MILWTYDEIQKFSDWFSSHQDIMLDSIAKIRVTKLSEFNKCKPKRR